MNKKILLAVAFAGLTLTACHRHTGEMGRLNDNDYNANSRHFSSYGYTQDHSQTDTHYDFVTGLGFRNVVNPNGYNYHHRYRLDDNTATEHDVFHGWRHTWVEPGDYRDKDIDVYRYTGDYNGEKRTIHILSHNGNRIGGYHFGEGESAEHATMIDHDGYFSRLADDFRETWDDLFNIRH